MLRTILLGMLGFIALLTTALIPEIICLPTLRTTLASIMNTPYLVTLPFIFSLIIISPMITILMVLSAFKKFVFNHSKNILNSFSRAIYTLLVSYSVATILVIVPFIADLAFRDDYYLTVRLSGIIRDNGKVHFFTVNLIMALLGQSAIFSLAFLITEVFLTYRFQVVSTTIKDFILKNSMVIVAVIGGAFITILMMYKIESGYTEKYIGDFYNIKNYRVTDKLAEGTIVTIVLMYLYALLAIHDG